MSSLSSAQALPRRSPSRVPGIVAAFAPLLVAATLGILRARSVWVKDHFIWQHKYYCVDPVADQVWLFSDEERFENGYGVAGLHLHKFREDYTSKRNPSFDNVASWWSSESTLKREEVKPLDFVNINMNDPQFQRHPDEVGPWKVFHWEFGVKEYKKGGQWSRICLNCKSQLRQISSESTLTITQNI